MGLFGPSPLEELLAVLDREAARGSHAAAFAARDIRRDGEPAIDALLGRCAAVVAQAKVWLTADAVVAAAAAYDKATTGTDWAAVVPEQVRAREAPSYEQVLARAIARRQETMQRISQRANARALEQVRRLQ